MRAIIFQNAEIGRTDGMNWLMFLHFFFFFPLPFLSFLFLFQTLDQAGFDLEVGGLDQLQRKRCFFSVNNYVDMDTN